MYNVHANIQASPGHFRMENRWFRYSSFVPEMNLMEKAEEVQLHLPS